MFIYHCYELKPWKYERAEENALKSIGAFAINFVHLFNEQLPYSILIFCRRSHTVRVWLWLRNREEGKTRVTGGEQTGRPRPSSGHSQSAVTPQCQVPVCPMKVDNWITFSQCEVRPGRTQEQVTIAIAAWLLNTS